MLLSYGIYTQGSQAVIEFVTNPDRLAELRRALVAASADKSALPEYFQALIEVTVENAVPGPASLVAVRIVPAEGLAAPPEGSGRAGAVSEAPDCPITSRAPL